MAIGFQVKTLSDAESASLLAQTYRICAEAQLSIGNKIQAKSNLSRARQYEQAVRDYAVYCEHFGEAAR